MSPASFTESISEDAALRDTLLCELISCDLRLKDAERQIEEATA